MWILSSSRTALQVLASPGQQAGQWIVRKIYKLLDRFAASWRPRVVFRWLPDPCKIQGSEVACELARKATNPDRQVPPYMKLKSAALRTSVKPMRERRSQFEARRGGQHTKQLDRALPGVHTRRLYSKMKRDEAQILAQLRTGKNRLNSALYDIKAVDSDSCDWCNRAETVRHFLVECPQWTTQRQQYLQTTTDRWTDVPFLLGGWTSERIDGPLQKWKPNVAAVRATISFAKATGRLNLEREEWR